MRNRSLNPHAGVAIADVPAPASTGLAFLCALAALATLLDFAAAAAYWSAYGVTPAQVLRAVASWVLGPQPPATAAVTALGAGVYFLIYLAMAAAFARLLPARPGFATGSFYGVIAYAVVYQLLVPLLVAPATMDRSPAWVATCVAVHGLLIGPLLAKALRAR